MKLLIPVIIAVLAGVGGGSGFAYMRTAKAFVADSVQRADSIKAHPPAKVAATKSHADSNATPGAESVPMTPADSLRALEATRAGTHGAAGADTAHGAKAASAPVATGKPTAANSGSAKPDSSATPPAVKATTDLADLVRAARNDAMSTALPEQRLAKIFAAMSPKDAAKVMDQMPDTDVRSILALMSDRSAAAVLSQFTPVRAATITKGASHATGSKP